MNGKNYPIKYAIMPVYEQVGWSHGLHELEREYDIVANIVSKCYVVEKKIVYEENKSPEIIYKVVFAMQECKEGYHSVYKRVKPSYNIYNQCINSICVSHVFDNFEDALVMCNNQNEEILKKSIMFLPFNSEIDERLKAIKKHHKETLNKYKKLEQQMEADTTDLEISIDYDFKLNEIVESILAKPKVFYIELASVLSKDEYNYLKNMIENKTCSNCLNTKCNEKKLINCDKWDNKELVGKQLLLTTSKDHKFY